MITPAEVAATLEGREAFALLDLRERGAYERGHVFGATSLPRRLLETRLPRLVPAPGTEIALCDEDGRLAALAGPTLRAMGYTRARALAGGLATWRAAGFPLVQGVNVPSKVFGERLLHAQGTPEISAPALRAAMMSGADLAIVDARTPEEYARGCIPGAVSVPGGELALRIPDLLTRPQTTIVVHCGGRTRSYVGAESLRRLGLPNPIVALTNGTMGWELAGFELERSAHRWPPPVSAGARERAAAAAGRIAAEDGVAFVTPAELRALVARRHEETLYVLDVRTGEEYAEGHVAGAVWAPGGQAIQAVDEYVAVRAGRIVCVCDGLVRSVLTASWLGRMGFPRVAVLRGGVAAWRVAGGAIEEGQPGDRPFGYEAARAVVPQVPPGSLDDAVVLSVDGSDAYARGHVPGAAWLCRSRLEWTVPQVMPDRGASLLVTCTDGTQSTLAAATLVGLGYRAARVLAGGTAAWRAAGLPVETGLAHLLDEPDDVVPKPYDRGREAMIAYLRWEEALTPEGQSPHALLPG